MAEWSNALVLKTSVPRGTGGSNPSFSAIRPKERLAEMLAFFVASILLTIRQKKDRSIEQSF
jgi:hypothetical protein